MKSLFQGKRKFLSIPILFILGFIFLPFAIGAGLVYLVYKKVPNQKIKYSTIALLTLLTIYINNIWIIGRTTPSTSNTTQFESQKQKTELSVSKTQITALHTSPTSFPTSTPDIKQSQETSFIRVIDGDTIEVLVNGKKETVRVIGIDTPEIVDPRKTVQCFGQEASRYAKLYFEHSGIKIWLEADPTQEDKDKYHRLLRHVFTDDNSVNFGKVMISLGYASEYTYNVPYKYQIIYKQAEKEARDNKKGLWADDACVATPTTTKRETTTGTTNPSSFSTTGDKDCKDFTTQNQAQTYFNSKGGSASNNVDRLDGNDHDGRVCEALP